MKTKFLLFLVVLISQQAMSQQQITVVDITTLRPVSGATIKTGEFIVTTNEKGMASVNGNAADKVTISHPLFSSVTMPYSELTANPQIMLFPQSVKLDELVVSANKSEEKKSDVPQRVMVVQSHELQNINAQTSADVLQQSGNVLVQKSQQGGGSPIIRGFEANRVLIVVDGIRMNNAIYRAGHLQNVLRVDNNMLDRLEVVMGPGSTMYGSDALGGVMHFHSRKPVFSSTDQTYVAGNAFYRYGSVNGESTGHLDFNIGLKKVAFLTSFTYSQFGDLWSGKNGNPFYSNGWDRLNYVENINGKDSMLTNPDPKLQVGTGYHQYDFLQKAAFKQSEYTTHTLNFQYSNTGEVPRYDRLTQYSGSNLKFAEWYYGPEKRMLAAYHLNNIKKTKMYDKLTFSASMQNIQESRVNRRFKKVFLTSQVEDVSVYAANFDLMKESGKHEMRYGAEFTYNDVQSSAKTEDIDMDTVTTAVLTRYPDGGSTYTTGAAYFSHTFEANEKFIITDGIRFNYVALHSDFSDTSLLHFPFTSIDQKNMAVTGSLGFIIKPCVGWKLSLVGSTGFRAPNVDDMGKVFESVPGTLIVPNKNLKPEYTYNADFTVEKTFSDKVVVSGTGFYTIAKNLISTQPYTWNGSDSIVIDGTPSRVIAQQNFDEGYVTGFNLNLAADITENFSITSTLNYTYGRIKTDTIDYPLDHIPPMFGKTAFVLQVKKFRNELSFLYNGWKHNWDYNMVGEDNFNSSTVYGSPAWFTMNFRTSFTVNKYLRLQAGVDNIFDKNYRVFASGINAPGRNIWFALRASF
ncbi:MAG: TonB-dependent receptor plug domain-containing protein [Bacteroidota bacterium]